jgi:UDP-GlcNAc3NAcA epimerase
MTTPQTVVSVIGARPQFVKAAVVSLQLRAFPGCREILVHTGQHYDANMSDVFFAELGLPAPHHHLGIHETTHGAMTGRMLEAVEKVLMHERPDVVMVYGDTNSTVAGALAAAKLNLPLAHVEAGLRSFNRRMPEEINRIVTDHCSTVLFAPTATAVANLEREGVRGERIHTVGDVMYDATLAYSERARRESRILPMLGLRPKSYVVTTIHRAETTDQPERLEAIVNALAMLAADIPVVLPLHPRTGKVLQRHRSCEDGLRKLLVIDPVGYLDMVMLEQSARLVVTDSGGVQKEAFFARVPCVTLRDETEWPELVELGWNRVVPPLDVSVVLEALREGLQRGDGKPGQPFGDGRAAERIASVLVSSCAGADRRGHRQSSA